MSWQKHLGYGAAAGAVGALVFLGVLCMGCAGALTLDALYFEFVTKPKLRARGDM